MTTLPAVDLESGEFLMSDTREALLQADTLASAPYFRSGYNYDRDQASLQSALRCADPSLAQQNFADDCDINKIVARFGIGPNMPEAMRLPAYGDFTAVTDYRSALDAVRTAEDEFMKLPAKVRFEFENDPQRFLQFVENPENLPAMREMGLCNPQAPKPAAAAPAAPSGPVPPVPPQMPT